MRATIGRRPWIEKLAWGATPEGFKRIVDSQGRRLVVRQDQAAHIELFMRPDGHNSIAEASHYHGRGVLKAVELPQGDTALVRPYRHGGFFRAITGELFFTWPPRPFRELALTEELRRRGLRTVEVYAAYVSPLGPFYRGWLVTKQLAGAEDLWSALQSGMTERVGLDAALRAVAESLRSMHRQGVYHADLNLKNILLRVEDHGPACYIIDYDKAKLFLGPLPETMANRNLMRLWRSVRRLDSELKFFSPAAWREFVSFYRAA
ncbi:MAG TPA: lipopolysaccharide kinase InaA family protein [Candidatus Binatia bacterium]